MKKRVFILLVIVLAIVGCKEENEVSSPLIESINYEIELLQNNLEKDSSNQELSYELGKKLFDLDLAYAKAKNVKPGNEPFLLENPDNKNCAILTHGFTASTWEIRELSEYLAKRNVTVYGVLLDGHGTKKEDLIKTEWKDWYNSVEKAYNTLRLMCNTVFVGGVSTGGAISLYLAENHEVEGVISIASPVFFMNKKIKFASIIKYFKKEYENQLGDNEKPYYYPSKPTVSIEQLFKFVNYYQKELHKITAPVMIMQSNNESTVNPKSASFIYENIGSKDKELAWFNGTQHVLTTSVEREEVFEKVYNFIIKRTTE